MSQDPEFFGRDVPDELEADASGVCAPPLPLSATQSRRSLRRSAEEAQTFVPDKRDVGGSRSVRGRVGRTSSLLALALETRVSALGRRDPSVVGRFRDAGEPLPSLSRETKSGFLLAALWGVEGFDDLCFRDARRLDGLDRAFERPALSRFLFRRCVAFRRSRSGK